MGFAAALLFLVPQIFHLSRDSRVDRFIGELSYPMYLCHVAIGNYFEPAQRVWQGGLLLLLSVLFSLPLVLGVERPLERWRQARLRTARQKVPADLSYPR